MLVSYWVHHRGFEQVHSSYTAKQTHQESWPQCSEFQIDVLLKILKFGRTGVDQGQDEEEVERQAGEVSDRGLRDSPQRVALHHDAN